MNFFVGSEDTPEAKARLVWGLCDLLLNLFMTKTTFRSTKPLLLDTSSWPMVDVSFSYDLDLEKLDKTPVGFLENLFHCRPSFHESRPVQMSRGVQCCDTDQDALLLAGMVVACEDRHIPTCEQLPKVDVDLLRAYLTGDDVTAVEEIQHLVGRDKRVKDIGIPHRLVRKALYSAWWFLIWSLGRASTTKDVIDAAAWIHNTLVAIHGFIDHNGRFAMAVAFFVLRIHDLVPFGYVPGYMDAITRDMQRSVRTKEPPYIKVSTHHLSAFIEGLQTNCFRCLAYPREGRSHPTCARCGHARYCSKDCQEIDWGRHKALCGRIAGKKK